MYILVYTHRKQKKKEKGKSRKIKNVVGILRITKYRFTIIILTSVCTPTPEQQYYINILFVLLQ